MKKCNYICKLVKFWDSPSFGSILNDLRARSLVASFDHHSHSATGTQLIFHDLIPVDVLLQGPMWIASGLTCGSAKNPHCLIKKADRTSRSDGLFHQQRGFMGTERSYSDPCRVLYWLSCTLISLFSQCSLCCSHRESFLELLIYKIGQPKTIRWYKTEDTLYFVSCCVVLLLWGFRCCFIFPRTSCPR